MKKRILTGIAGAVFCLFLYGCAPARREAPPAPENAAGGGADGRSVRDEERYEREYADRRDVRDEERYNRGHAGRHGEECYEREYSDRHGERDGRHRSAPG